MAIRNPRLPMIPGYSLNSMIGKKSFGVRPIFTSVDGVRMLIDKYSGENRVPSLYPRKSAPDLPTWILYDKQILKFQAYFQQTLQERREPAVIRKVNILFYLEDGTIKVMEPKTENSGLLQGVMIGRQRIRLPFSYDVYYDVLDLNVGKEVDLYGKIFKIVDCDNFTRVFLNRLGIHVPDRIPWPSYDPPKFEAQQSNPKHFALKQFLDFDRKVLRFKGYWDDRDTPFGYIHQLEIHYYLADDHMEIKEIPPPGQAGGPMFLKKCRLPRNLPNLVEMSGGPPIPSYSPADLTIGAVVNLYGRKVILTDCDEYTKEFYRVKYGIDNFTPLKIPDDTSHECIGTNVSERQLPPWNGYGSYEDSAQNCRTVDPKPPHRDFIKFLHKDRVGFDSHILRFAARLITDDPNNDIRYFIISYYLCDDTIGVFELAERNSGFKGGKFMKREAMYLPGYERFVPQPPPTFRARDLLLGGELLLNAFRFRLIAADEYTLRYMELNPIEFPQANVALILKKIGEVLLSKENGYKNFVARHMAAAVPDRTELMTTKCFKQALDELLEGKLTEHEFVTLARHFRGDAGRQHRPHREMIRSLVFSSLTRELWDDMDRLKETLMHADEESRQVMSRHRLRQTLRACRLPLSDQLMDCLLNVLEKDEECNIRYADLYEFLDFKTRPIRGALSTEEELRQLVRHAPPLKHTQSDRYSYEMLIYIFGKEKKILGDIGSLCVFYRLYHGEYSKELHDAIPPSPFYYRSMRNTLKMHPHTVDIPPLRTNRSDSYLEPLKWLKKKSSRLRPGNLSYSLIGPSELSSYTGFIHVSDDCLVWETADRLIEEGYVNWSAFLCQLDLEHTIQ